VLGRMWPNSTHLPCYKKRETLMIVVETQNHEKHQVTMHTWAQVAELGWWKTGTASTKEKKQQDI